MRKPAALAIITLLALTACKQALSDKEIMAMDNKSLCEAVQARPDDGKLMTFMFGRKLSCHPFQISCKNAGFKVGTKGYSGCISAMVDEAAKEKAESARMGAAIGQAFQNYGNSLNQNNVGYIQPPYQAPTYTAPAAPTQSRCTVTPGNAMFPQSQVNCRSY